MGARWDARVPAGVPLEPFNRWFPNFKKCFVCNYHEKADAKMAGVQWDFSCQQLCFQPYYTEAEAKLARWLPSSKSNAAKAKAAALTQSQIAMLSKINSGRTVMQLVGECRARDPSVPRWNKDKSWLLEH